MKIVDAANLLKKKEISGVELTMQMLKNIKKYDNEIGAYITVCEEEAIKQAEKADMCENKTLLTGIPIAVKDNICTKNILTTAGSKMLKNFCPVYDATVVEKLKNNGAVIIGKTNMDEFGMGSATQNSAFKKTCNPVNPKFVPGGSSGGSAAAVSGNMALGALGSDSGGSVRQPAAFCGLYGLKPTYSRISRYGLIAFASSLDTIGIMGKCAEDTAVIYNLIAGFDKKDATSYKESDSISLLSADMRDMKIGLPAEFFENTDKCVKDSVLSAAKNFELMGAKVEECSVKSLKYAVSAYYIISSSEASSNLARYDGVRFTERCEEYENLAEMYVKSRSENFGDEVKRRILLGTFALSEGYYDLYYLKAKAAQKKIKKEFEKLFEYYDVLITPVSPVMVWKKDENADFSQVYSRDICTASVSLAGLPAISVPCGKDSNNMPIGMQIITSPFKENVILNAAYAYEKGGFNNGV